MSTLSRPRLVLPLAVLVAVASVLVSACSTFVGPAWQVGDVSMSVEEFLTAYDQDQGTSSSTASTTGERMSTADLAAFMTTQIQEELRTQIIEQGLANEDIEVTQEDRDAAELAYQNQASQSGSASQPSEEDIETQARFIALGRKLTEAGIEAGIIDVDADARQLYEERKDQLVEPAQTCAHFILIPAGDLQAATTEPSEADYEAARTQAEEVRTRLATEDFATISAEVSAIDEQVPGGDFGCQPIDSFPQEVVPIVEDLEPGVLSEPARIQGGYLITRVDSRTEEQPPPPFEEVEDQAREAVLNELGQRLVNEWLLDRSRGTFVSVDPRFGTWNVDTATVDPPEGAADPTVPTTPFTALDPSEAGGLGIDPSQLETSGS